MSAAFDEFLRQHTASGSEKADGYSKAAFEGLSDEEMKQAFDLLEKELPYSVEWLFFLDPIRAKRVAENEEATSRKNSYYPTFILQRELLKQTGDLTYQQHMFEDYPHYADHIKPQAVDSLGKTPVSPDLAKILQSIVLTEVNEKAVARAAFHLVRIHSVPTQTEDERNKFWRLVANLKSDSALTKANTFKTLDTVYPIV